MDGEDVSLPPSIDTTATTLVRLEPGQRAWFWMCFDVPSSAPALLIQLLEDDPDQRRLRAQLNEMVWLEDATIASGLVMVDEDGRLNFLSAQLTETLLDALISWTRIQYPRHPRLARLRGARFVCTNAEGVVRATYTNAQRWADLPAFPTAGTIAETAHLLEEMKPGHSAWFWLTIRGPGQQPFLSMLSTEHDPDGVAFQARLRRLRRRSGPGAAPATSGLARMGADGQLTLTTSAAQQWQEALAAVLTVHRRAYPAFARMETARLFVLTGDKAGPPQRLPAWWLLTKQNELLDALKSGERLAFWFTNRARHGKPLLMLGADPKTLREEVIDAVGNGHSSRGMLRIGKNDRIDLRIKKPHPDLLQHLAQWVIDAQPHSPALTRLRDAKLFVVRKDGKMKKIEEPEVWKPLSIVEE